MSLISSFNALIRREKSANSLEEPKDDSAPQSNSFAKEKSSNFASQETITPATDIYKSAYVPRFLSHDDYFFESESLPMWFKPSKYIGAAPIPIPRNTARYNSQYLDITRITNRLIAVGPCWTHQTDVFGHRNNINELSSFLDQRYGSKYMIFNLAGTAFAFLMLATYF